MTAAFTASLLALAAVLTAAWVLLLLCERGIRPMRDVVRMVRELPPLGRAVVPALFVVTWLAASTKPGDGGTNNVPQMVIGSGVNVANVGMLPINQSQWPIGIGNIGTGNNFTLATLFFAQGAFRLPPG